MDNVKAWLWETFTCFITKSRVILTQTSCVSDKWCYQWLFVLPLFISIASPVGNDLLDLLRRTLSTLGSKKSSQIDLVYTCNTKIQITARSVGFIPPYFVHLGRFCLSVGNKLKNYSEEIFWVWLKERSTRVLNISDAGLDFNPI